MERHCDACGARYQAKATTSKYCPDIECKRQRERARKRRNAGGQVLELPARPPVELVDGLGPHEQATRDALDAAGRLHSAQGVNAIGLAGRLDRAAGESGAGYAALARQHLAALEKALEGAAQAADPIDELFARRQKKLGAS